MHMIKVYFIHTMKIPDYIKGVRKKLGLTQEQFSKLLSSNRFNITNYETGRAIPPGDILLKIQALDSDREKAA